MKDKPPTLGDAIRQGTEYLASHGLETARRDTELLAMNAIGRDRAFLYSHPEWPVPEEQWQKLQQWLGRRKDRYPIQYLVGSQEFYGRTFLVDPSVLIPRPETELLIETSLRLIPDRQDARVVDIGTGSGCIAVTLACERPLLRATAIDISEEALRVARENARRLGCAERIEFVQGDLLKPFESSGRKFDLILSNPPYGADESPEVEYSVRTFEPQEAVFAGPTGLEIYEGILRGSAAVLHSSGRLVLEIGYSQLAGLTALAKQNGWTLLECRNDLAGIPRCAVLRKGAGI
ncbi:MAG: peptide chain release factor N(5)-glutamine methyltransferase [Acidobacteria bacterium]|nr:MAG: peptide chain release factor N(5)-glutamine methyltransferase [Acidobacteriota bacterium]